MFFHFFKCNFTCNLQSKRQQIINLFAQDLKITTQILKVGETVWLVPLEVLFSSMPKIINNLFQALKTSLCLEMNWEIYILLSGISFLKFSTCINLICYTLQFMILTKVKPFKIAIHILCTCRSASPDITGYSHKSLSNYKRSDTRLP